MTAALCAFLIAAPRDKTPVILAVDSLVVGYRSGAKWFPTGHDYGLKLPPLQFHSFDLGRSKGTLSGIKLEDGGDVGGAMLHTEKADGAVHLSGATPTFPRPVKAITARPEATRILQTFLVAQGLKRAKARITKIVEVDLDGDGTKETLLEARNRENVASLNAKWTAADYSAVLLIHGGKALPLEFESYAKSESMELKRLRGIADLDGDGRMEVVTDGQGYEWTNVNLWSYRAGHLTKLLENGAGA